ncbi:MAG: response regulator [Gemmatimonadota bacterium]|nr:response regulator [Gemmatimonadota bacterium]
MTVGPILVVDDEAMVRMVVSRVAEDLGYVVAEAEHGGRALEMLVRLAGHVRLVITDYEMPVVNGIDLIRNVRERWPDVPVLCISGYTHHIEHLQRLLDPPCRTLVKPFDLDRLADEIRAAAGEP